MVAEQTLTVSTTDALRERAQRSLARCRVTNTISCSSELPPAQGVNFG